MNKSSTESGSATGDGLRFQILALSGGGYLGLYTARILAELEKRAGRPIGSCFDLICGTSIGGILALGLGAEVPAAEMLAAFERDGDKIFSDRPRPRGRVSETWDVGRMLFKPKYDGRHLRLTVEGMLGDQRLSASKHRLLIPAVNMTTGTVRMFKTGHRADLTADHPLPMVDIAMATSAAPTYFPLAEIGDSLFADGGLAANAPDLCGLHEATCFLGQAIEDIHVLSIGTTTSSFGLAHAKSGRMGALRWLSEGQLFASMIGAQQQLIHSMLGHRLDDRYLRLDAAQSKSHQAELALDVATAEARKTVLGLAEGTLQKEAGCPGVRQMLAHRAAAPRFFNAVS